jgi:hypothetical protein
MNDQGPTSSPTRKPEPEKSSSPPSSEQPPWYSAPAKLRPYQSPEGAFARGQLPKCCTPTRSYHRKYQDPHRDKNVEEELNTITSSLSDRFASIVSDCNTFHPTSSFDHKTAPWSIPDPPSTVPIREVPSCQQEQERSSRSAFGTTSSTSLSSIASQLSSFLDLRTTSIHDQDSWSTPSPSLSSRTEYSSSCASDDGSDTSSAPSTTPSSPLTSPALSAKHAFDDDLIPIDLNHLPIVINVIVDIDIVCTEFEEPSPLPTTQSDFSVLRERPRLQAVDYPMDSEPTQPLEPKLPLQPKRPFAPPTIHEKFDALADADEARKKRSGQENSAPSKRQRILPHDDDFKIVPRRRVPFRRTIPNPPPPIVPPAVFNLLQQLQIYNQAHNNSDFEPGWQLMPIRRRPPIDLVYFNSIDLDADCQESRTRHDLSRSRYVLMDGKNHVSSLTLARLGLTTEVTGVAQTLDHVGLGQAALKQFESEAWLYWSAVAEEMKTGCRCVQYIRKPNLGLTDPEFYPPPIITQAGIMCMPERHCRCGRFLPKLSQNQWQMVTEAGRYPSRILPMIQGA